MFVYVGILIFAFSCSAEINEQIDVEDTTTDSFSVNEHDLVLQSSINYTHELCGDYDIGSTGVVALNSKREILFDTADSLGNGKFILVGSEATENSIYENYDSFLTLKNETIDVFWCSIYGHFLENEPTKFMYERKKIFVHNVAFLGEDSTSLEIPSVDSMTVEKLF